MKKIIIALTLLASVPVMAQNVDSLVSAQLAGPCGNLDTLSTIQMWKQRSAEIDKVKNQYPANWIPAYYSAYCAVQMSYFETNVKLKDIYLDAADKSLAVVKESCPLKDEVFVLTAMVANARLAVDPQNRWKEYGKIFDENLELAKKENENNPHIYLAKGMSVYYTPKMFGGGAKNAMEYFTKAEEKYKLQTETKVEKPFWGKATTEYMIAECKK
jgi:nucleoside-diphosphate-sugar epimerase